MERLIAESTELKRRLDGEEHELIADNLALETQIGTCQADIKQLEDKVSRLTEELNSLNEIRHTEQQDWSQRYEIIEQGLNERIRSLTEELESRFVAMKVFRNRTGSLFY
jgi:predicted nuclease with TOPRIM domain